MGKKAKQRVLDAPEVVSVVLELADENGQHLFRKKILPLGTITYPKTAHHPGGRVTFDRAYHQTLIDSFKAKCFDNPTVQLAAPGVEHNADPRLTVGSIVDLSHEQTDDVDGPGLYATIRAHSDDDAAVFRKNPMLGASPEIVEGRHRVDGQTFKAAIHHVLGTLRGRVVGLGAWRAISLSASNSGPVIDLTDAEYEELDDMGKKRTEGGTQVLSLSDDEIEAALEAAAEALGEFDNDEPTFVQSRRVQLAGGGFAQAGGGGSSETLLSLSAELDTTSAELTGVKAQLARTQWEKDRAKYSGGDGKGAVPKRMLDLAEDVLAYPGESVISLADEDADIIDVDARKVIRDMLDACPRISLSEPDGSGEEPPSTLTPDAPEFVGTMLAVWERQSGS